MIFGWKKMAIWHGRILLSFLPLIFTDCEACKTWNDGVNLQSLGWLELWAKSQLWAPGLFLGLPNAPHLSRVCSVSFFTCYRVTWENGSMMCLCLYCRKMDLVMWGRWGRGPQLPRGRKAGGEYSGRKTLWTSRWLKVLVGLWPFSIWCIIFYVLMADLVTITVCFFKNQSCLVNWLQQWNTASKALSINIPRAIPGTAIDRDTEYKQITLCMSHSSYKTQQ